MENRSELSDIVLEKGSDRSSNLKRILMVVAFLVLIFLIALASMKMMNKDPKKDPSKLILPPENNNSQEVPATKDDQLFNQKMPIIEENPKQESFENMIKTLKEKELQKQEEANKKVEAKAPSENIEPKEAPTKAPPPPVKPKEEPKKPTTQATPSKQPTTTAATTPSKSTPSSPKTTATAGNIYIQVGAVTTTPEPKVLNNLKAKGFEYKLYPVDVNGKQITKILVGPYAKAEDAQTALISVRANVNKDAFIYKVK